MSDISSMGDEIDDDGELAVNIHADGAHFTLWVDLIDLQQMAEVFGLELVPIDGVN